MAYKTSMSNPAESEAASQASPTNAARGITDLELRFRAALVLWLRWNEAYEKATSHLFAAGQSAEKIEDYMDSMDQLRREAISRSHNLLD